MLLSGESSTLPEAEARSLIFAQDEQASIEKPEDRILLARTSADPYIIASRIAFSRRVGELVPDEKLNSVIERIRGSSFMVNVFDLHDGDPSETEKKKIIANVAEKMIAGRVDLEDPEYEITVVRGTRRDYYSVTKSGMMRQDWIRRRPRERAFFHPTAMFPKISRCLVNLTRVAEGEVILDPFVGTGSILLEGDIVGAEALGVDMSRKMVRGANRNQEKFGQRWLGIVLADSLRLPLKRVDAIATDIPYGRASSTEGSATRAILDGLVVQSGWLLKGDGRLVVMHPLDVPASPDERFDVEGEHLIYVHRKLTRAITVMRRRT